MRPLQPVIERSATHRSGSKVREVAFAEVVIIDHNATSGTLPYRSSAGWITLGVFEA